MFGKKPLKPFFFRFLFPSLPKKETTREATTSYPGAGHGGGTSRPKRARPRGAGGPGRTCAGTPGPRATTGGQGKIGGWRRCGGMNRLSLAVCFFFGVILILSHGFL